MTETAYKFRIDGIALVADLAAADAVGAQLPGAECATLFSTGWPLCALGGGPVIARMATAPARHAPAAAVQQMIDTGLPACIQHARVTPRQAWEGGVVGWLASLGYEVAPLETQQ